jgi:hypothetical protein
MGMSYHILIVNEKKKKKKMSFQLKIGYVINPLATYLLS